MNEQEFRASEAKRLLDEPLLKEALDGIEWTCIDEMLALPTTPDANAQRLALVDRVNTIRELRSRLRSIIAAGQQSARRLNVA